MNQEWIYRILKRDEVTPKDITINYNTPSKIELILHANKYEMMMRMFWERTNVTYKIERQFGRFMRPVKMSVCIPTAYQKEMESRFDSLIEELNKDEYEIILHPSGGLSLKLLNLDKDKDPTSSMSIFKFDGHYDYNCGYREYR